MAAIMTRKSKRRQFKAWLLEDREGTYVPSLHMTRRDAIFERGDWTTYRDAKPTIRRVLVTVL